KRMQEPEPSSPAATPTGRRLPTWREMNRDTSPEAEAILFQLWREAPAWRKLQLMVCLNRSARQLALLGLRRRFPEASEAELQRRLASLLLGEELAARVYGPLPDPPAGQE